MPLFRRGKNKQEQPQPIMVLSDRKNSVELWPSKLTIRRHGVMNAMTVGLAGDKDIYLNTITGIQLKKPCMTTGYIQFQTVGSQDNKGGLTGAVQGENTDSNARRHTMARIAIVVLLLLLALSSGVSASAQTTMFTCEDFITQASAQASLDRMPDDPYGLDPDGNGIACEDMVTGGGQIATSNSDNESEVEPAEYEIVEQEFQQVARPRVVLRITVEEAGDDATALALTEAIAEGLDDEPDALVAHVFAYREGDDTDGGYSVGIAQGSRDGLGWTGDGQLGLQFDAEDEQGMVTVLLDSAISDVEERRLTMPLVLDGQGTRSEPAVAQEQTADVSAEEGAYASELGSQMTVVGESMTTFSELMAAPRLGQDDWTLQLVGVIVTWQFAEDEALAMTPPPAFAEVHGSYLKSLGYLNVAGDDIVVGIDTFDVERLNRAATNLELANAELVTTQNLIDRLLEERGIE